MSKEEKTFVWTDELVTELCISFYGTNFIAETIEKIDRFKKANASEGDIMNEPCLSINDIISVWPQRYLSAPDAEEAPLLARIKELANKKQVTLKKQKSC